MKAHAWLVASAMLAATPASAEGLFHCWAKDGVAMTDDGLLTRGEGSAEFGKWLWSDFIVDTDTGVIRYARIDEAVYWQVLQRGDSGNDTVLGPKAVNSAAANTILRVRNWSDQPAPIFFAFSISSATSGTCERL